MAQSVIDIRRQKDSAGSGSSSSSSSVAGVTVKRWSDEPAFLHSAGVSIRHFQFKRRGAAEQSCERASAAAVYRSGGLMNGITLPTTSSVRPSIPAPVLSRREFRTSTPGHLPQPNPNPKL